MKNMTNYWWAITFNHGHLMFYGCGETAAEHHNGESTSVRKIEESGDNITCTTASGSVYKLKKSKMKKCVGAMINYNKIKQDLESRKVA